MNKNIKKTVEKILLEDEYTRKDDNYLILKVVQDLMPESVDMAFSKVMYKSKYKGISFESITRRRRKFMQEHPELKNPEITLIREQEEEKYILEYGGKR